MCVSGEVRKRKDSLGSTNPRETGVLKRYEQSLMPKESRLAEAKSGVSRCSGSQTWGSSFMHKGGPQCLTYDYGKIRKLLSVQK